MTRVAVVAASAAVRDDIDRTLRAAPALTVTTLVASTDALASDSRLASSDAVLLHTTSELTARELDALPPIPVIILLGGRRAPETVRRMLAAGARGVLPDDATAEEVLAAVDAAVAGLIVLPPEVMSEIVAVRPAASGARAVAASAGAPAGRAPTLTPREREVLAMLAEGLPNKLVASRLGISEHTVKTHVEALFEKLGASTRAEAVARAVRSGLLLL